ncbi:hypothetical protein Tco_0595615 [Tanacetum coccineum]
MYVPLPSITIVEATDGSDHLMFRWENRWPGSNIKQGCHHLVLSGKWGEEASKSKSGQSEKETQSSLAKDKSPSHPSPPTPVVGDVHKEAHQAADGPTSLGATSKERAHSLLSSGTNPSVLVDQTKSAGDGLKTAHTNSGTNEEFRADEISKKIKMEDLSDLLKDTRSTFFTPDSPQDEPIIVLDESEEEETKKDKDTHPTSHDLKDEEEVALLKATPSYPNINQLTKLLVTSLKPELSKLLASHDFASCLPTKLIELPLKFTKLSGDIKELKQHVRDIEIELPGDLKEILTKLETFTSTISNLISQVVELDNIQWELPTKFATMVENVSGATTKDVSSAGQATASPAEGEKNTNPAIKDVEPNLHNELVDLLGIDVVTQYYNKKLLYDKYCDKMLKRRKSSKITNCDVLIQKGTISLKVYREDRTIEVILNFKVSDLHLAE